MDNHRQPDPQHGRSPQQITQKETQRQGSNTVGIDRRAIHEQRESKNPRFINQTTQAKP